MIVPDALVVNVRIVKNLYLIIKLMTQQYVVILVKLMVNGNKEFILEFIEILA